MAKLTNEQLKRARDAYNAVIVQDDTTTAQALEAAAEHLQYAQEALADVVKAMREAWQGSKDETGKGRMTAAFHVCAAWFRERTIEQLRAIMERHIAGPKEHVEAILEDLRAHPLVPAKTVEERVTVQEWLLDRDQWIVLVDGCNMTYSATFPKPERERAEIYREGLISHLKREGR